MIIQQTVCMYVSFSAALFDAKTVDRCHSRWIKAKKAPLLSSSEQQSERASFSLFDAKTVDRCHSRWIKAKKAPLLSSSQPSGGPTVATYWKAHVVERCEAAWCLCLMMDVAQLLMRATDGHRLQRAAMRPPFTGRST